MKPDVKRILAKLSKEKVELGLADNVIKEYDKIKNDSDSLYKIVRKAAQDVDEVSQKATTLIKKIDATDADVKKLVKAANDLGIDLPPKADIATRQLQAYRSDLKELESRTSKASDGLFALMG